MTSLRRLLLLHCEGSFGHSAAAARPPSFGRDLPLAEIAIVEHPSGFQVNRDSEIIQLQRHQTGNGMIKVVWVLGLTLAILVLPIESRAQQLEYIGKPVRGIPV